MTLEAIIATLALVTGLPSTVLIVWKCIQHYRRVRRGDEATTSLDLQPAIRTPVLWEDVHHDRAPRPPGRRVLSASFELMLDDGLLLPTRRSVNR